MPNPFFNFKQFTVYHDRCAMKVTTDGCLFGAWVAAQLEGNDAVENLLDIGAGSGLLSLMVAQKTQGIIDAVEVDAAAVGQAIENIAASIWRDRIRIHAGDIKVFEKKQPFDVIFSNPPFYEQEWESDKASRNVAHHGHGLRLDDLLQHCSRLLKPGGDLYLLLPMKREAAITQALAIAGIFIHKKVRVFPSTSHPAFRLMLHVTKVNNVRITEEQLFIKDDLNQYTGAFTYLLKDYYLYL